MLSIVSIIAPSEENASISQVGGGTICAGGQPPGHDCGGEAGGGLGAVVYGAEVIAQPLEEGAVPLVVAGVEGHGAGAIVLFDLVEARDDLVIGLIPGDGLKFALAPLADPAQGGHDAVFAIDILPVGLAFGAEQTVVGRMAVGALHFDDLPVLHIAGHAAVWAGGANVAEAVAGDDAGVLAGDLCVELFFRGAHACSPPSKSVRNSSVKPSRASSPRRAAGSGALLPVKRFMM